KNLRSERRVLPSLGFSHQPRTIPAFASARTRPLPTTSTIFVAIFSLSFFIFVPGIEGSQLAWPLFGFIGFTGDYPHRQGNPLCLQANKKPCLYRYFHATYLLNCLQTLNSPLRFFWMSSDPSSDRL